MIQKANDTVQKADDTETLQKAAEKNLNLNIDDVIFVKFAFINIRCMHDSQLRPKQK